MTFSFSHIRNRDRLYFPLALILQQFRQITFLYWVDRILSNFRFPQQYPVDIMISIYSDPFAFRKSRYDKRSLILEYIHYSINFWTNISPHGRINLLKNT